MAYSIGGQDKAYATVKLIRTINVGIRVSGGGGSARPTSGQVYPRGKG